MTVLDAILQSLRRAGEFNRDDQVAPAVILWPDKDPCKGLYRRGSIGWHPDLNDGVRLNIRPFMEADVLRKRPNIKWDKDRGTPPAPCGARSATTAKSGPRKESDPPMTQIIADKSRADRNLRKIGESSR